jgi:hypothetical protein
LGAPLLTLVHVVVAPEDAAALEAAVTRAGGGPAHALLRPIDGTDEHLLLIPAARLSELGAQAAWLRGLVRAIAAEHVHLVTWRNERLDYRPDLGTGRR